MHKKPKIAAVDYINAWPLTRGLPWAVSGFRPAEMTGTNLELFDLILAPVALAFNKQGWNILPNAPAIGCRGEVGSVRLEIALGKSLENIERIALSSESQTSNRLLLILLTKYWRRSVSSFTVELPSNTSTNFDARLIIGDQALSRTGATQGVDLGSEWMKWTGLPFVFAAWMAKDQRFFECANELVSTRNNNIKNINELILEAKGVTSEASAHYFTKQLCYDFGPEQKAGLERFFSELQELAENDLPFSQSGDAHQFCSIHSCD